MKLLAALFYLTIAVSALEDKILEEFRVGNQLLTSDIYKELRESPNGNFLLSPFSAETILALTLSGAKGQTADELAAALRLPKQADEIFLNLIPQLRSDAYTLLSANKIYLKENFSIHDEFKKTAVDKYQAELQEINFGEKPEAAREINGWVEKQTRSKIRDIVTENDLNEFTRLVLINALYFQANWTNQFENEATIEEDFFAAEKETSKANFMHQTNYFNYYECSQVDAKFLELSFLGDNASFVVVLPNDKNGIANLESKIEKVFTPRNFTWERVQVALPKFKIESTIDFKQILQKLGVQKVFNGAEADLSGIGGQPGDLEVSAIRQKTYIDLQEGGVEAAAATAVFIGLTASAVIPPSPPKIFRADHPFIFYIKVQDVILFAGKVSRP